MKKLIHVLQNNASGKLVLVLLLITMAIYLTMIFYSIPAVVSFAPELVLFDMSPTGYSYQNALELLGVLGPEGRSIYLTRQLPLDFIYPGLFAITYSLLLVWLLLKSISQKSKIFYLTLVPILAGICDYIENIFIIVMINSFPDFSSNIVGAASLFTIMKSSFTSIFFILLLWAVFMYFKNRRNIHK
tara:strand:- start:8317 stop:8877 length:561 start_codon:yes stop_codon:yes gene_type:complete